jgi:hypothetical protein
MATFYVGEGIEARKKTAMMARKRPGIPGGLAAGPGQMRRSADAC